MRSSEAYLTVSYASPQSTGTLTFTPVSDASGSTTITITVEDGGPDNNLSTTADNAKLHRTLGVTVNAVNDIPTLDALASVTINQGASQQSVSLAGVTAGGGETQPHSTKTCGRFFLSSDSSYSYQITDQDWRPAIEAGINCYRQDVP